MSGFQNTAKVFTFIYPEWDKDKDGKSLSEWVLRSRRTDKGEDAVNSLTTRWITDTVGEEELKKAEREARDVSQLILDRTHAESMMSTKRATLVAYTKSWDGPEFTLDADQPLLDKNGDAKVDAEGKEIPDPYAGQVPPVNAYYMGIRDPDEVSAAYRALRAEWAGAQRSPEEQKTFRGTDPRLDGPDDGQPAAKVGEKPERSARVSRKTQ